MLPGVRDRRRLALGAAAVLGWLLVIGLARAEVAFPGHALAPVSESLAFLVQALLQAAGSEVARHGALLYVPGTFAYEIVIGCSGLLPAGVITTAILASPGTSTAKVWGVLVGVPAVLLVNLLRLAHLFHVGVTAPGRFALAHEVLWEALLVAFVLALWWSWSRWGPAKLVSRAGPAAY